MKKWFSEKTIMSLVMVVLAGVVIVTGTIAWFVIKNMPRIENLKLETDGLPALCVDVKIEPYTVDLNQEAITYSDFYTNEELKTSEYATLSSDGVNYDITRMSLAMADDNADVTICLGQEEMNSLEPNKLAPGAFGKVTFYIKSVNTVIGKYRIEVAPQPLYASDTYEEERKQELQKLVEDHIRFYKECLVDEFDPNSRTYSERILCEEGEGLEGTLVRDTEQVATIYWCWPYEYTDIPAESVSGGNGMPTVYSTTSTDVESYDLGDTQIGNYVINIRFSFAVIGEEYESVSG